MFTSISATSTTANVDSAILAGSGRSPAAAKGRRSPKRSLAGAGAPTTAPGQRDRSEADHLSRLLRLKRRPQMRVQDILRTKGAKLSAILPDASIREAAPSSLQLK